MKMQSMGNLIAVASFKPDAVNGQVEANVGALGRIAVGEIVETMVVRLFSFNADPEGGAIGREIPGSPQAREWHPWEVKFENEALAVSRTTDWLDRHVQRWCVAGNVSAVVVWIDFETRTPGEWRLGQGEHHAAQWHSATGDVIAVMTDGRIGAMCAGQDCDVLKARLQRGESGSTPIVPAKRWYRGTVAWVRHGPPEGIFALTIGPSCTATDEKLSAITADPAAIVRQARREWESFYEDEVPACPCNNASDQALWRDAWFVLRSGRMHYDRAPLRKPFGSPSKFNYHHQWLWDSGFQSIVWRWANSTKWAREETANLFENQLEQGRICHEIFHNPWRRNDNWPGGEGCFAPTSQPPVLAMAAECVFARTNDQELLVSTYDRLIPYLDWWMTVRDPDGDGLAGWANGYESGLDDSPRWDHITRKGNAYFPAPLEAVELNALLVNEWRSVRRLATLLHRNADVERATQASARIVAAMRAKLWNEADGFFYCLDHEEKPIRLKTVAGLLGLLALEPGDPEVAPLLKHLTDEREFWTPFPVPSVAVDEPAFRRGQMWRGPTWMNINWLLIRALERLGEIPIALELKRRTLAMAVSEGTPKLWEWYDPISGKALGNMEYGWSTLVIDLMMS